MCCRHRLRPRGDSRTARRVPHGLAGEVSLEAGCLRPLSLLVCARIFQGMLQQKKRCVRYGVRWLAWCAVLPLHASGFYQKHCCAGPVCCVTAARVGLLSGIQCIVCQPPNMRGICVSCVGKHCCNGIQYTRCSPFAGPAYLDRSWYRLLPADEVFAAALRGGPQRNTAVPLETSSALSIPTVLVCGAFVFVVVQHAWEGGRVGEVDKSGEKKLELAVAGSARYHLEFKTVYLAEVGHKTKRKGSTFVRLHRNWKGRRTGVSVVFCRGDIGGWMRSYAGARRAHLCFVGWMP